MRALKRFLTKLHNFAARRTGDARLREEMEQHLAMQTEENIRCGMTEEEAWRQARLKFGGVEGIRESYHAENGFPFFENLLRDVRHSIRLLGKSAGFTTAVVVTLALGIGSSSAIFCLMDALWLHPMHVPHPGRIVRVFATTQQFQDGLFSYPDYQAMAQRATAFQGGAGGLVAIGGRGSLMPRPDGTSQMLLTDVVSSNFFTVLGVRPMLGRVFTTQDAALVRAHPGVVLGHSCWKRDFAGDPNIVGRSITLLRGKDTRVQFDVWGVLPPSFREIDPNDDRCLWMPAESWAAFRAGEELTSREFRWLTVLGRLTPGATAAQANQQVAAIADALAATDPASDKGRGARAISDFRYRMDQAGTTGLVLFGIVGGVVLLAVVNVAHLLLARALDRAPETSLRLSLGATRWAVARQLLVENLLLATASLGAGLGLAAVLAAVLPRLLVLEPAMLETFGAPLNLQVDARVFLFAFALVVAILIPLALVPLSQAARTELLPAMQASAATRTAGKTPLLRRAAVWLQIGISFALLVSTSALVCSFVNTRTRDIGLTRGQVLELFTQEPEAPMREAVLANLRTLPGVVSAAYAIRAPLMPSESGMSAKVILPSHPELHDPVPIKFDAVSPDYLNVVGTRILRGRGFTSADDENGPPVIIVNQAMARKYWPDANPVGQVVKLPDLGGTVGKGMDAKARVIGVAEDVPINQIGEIPEPYMYLPFHLMSYGEIAFVVETRQNAMSVAQNARQALIRVNPLLDPMMVTSLPELIRYASGNYQMMAELVSTLGLIGLALTVVGLYGFLAFRVTQRRREIGIRMALGATHQAMARLILRDTAGMAALGLMIGVGLAVAAARVEASLLFEVRPLDAFSVTAAATVLALAVSVATWLPARRAATIEPMQALRSG
jgi:predicted permease